MYTMDDLLKLGKKIAAWQVVCDIEEFAIYRPFDPRGITHEDWADVVYPIAKHFLKGLTEENMKEMLDRHRDLYDSRDNKNDELEVYQPPLFKRMPMTKKRVGEERERHACRLHLEDHRKCRLYPLKDKKYAKVKRQLEKKNAIRNAVVIFNGGKLKIAEEDNAGDLLNPNKI